MIAEVARRFSMLAVAAAFVTCVVAGEGKESVSEGKDAQAPPVVKAAVAAGYIDKVATVEGTVASVTFIPRIKGRPTFVNLEKKHPHSPFTVVIWSNTRNKFVQPPDEVLKDKTIRVTGRIGLHDEKPQIVLTSPEQIAIAGEEGTFHKLSARPPEGHDRGED
jgi:DNA/RNA endonuclease YhcR with UshA esterase domain